MVVPAFTSAVHTDWRRARAQAPPGALVLPELLSCLVLSLSDPRAQLLASIAKEESWQVELCTQPQEFLRSVFQCQTPLTLVDLPPRDNASYQQVKELVTRAHGIQPSLMLVCGAEQNHTEAHHTEAHHAEEQWARQLGAWAYLPTATDSDGLRLVFKEARKAVAKQSTGYVEALGYR